MAETDLYAVVGGVRYDLVPTPTADVTDADVSDATVETEATDETN